MMQQPMSAQSAEPIETLLDDGRYELRFPDGHVEYEIRPVLSGVEAILAEQRDHILTIDEIEAADDILTAKVWIPEWRGSVIVTQFSKDTEFKLRKQATIGGKVDRERLEMLIVINGMLEPPVTEEHLGLLQSKAQSAVDRILSKIVAMNAVSQEEADKAVAEFLEGRRSALRMATSEGTRADGPEPDAPADVESDVREVEGVSPG